eukprot:COSAG01_NODE_1496_length_10123_cov_3.358739_7_plen_284_part_00
MTMMRRVLGGYGGRGVYRWKLGHCGGGSSGGGGGSICRTQALRHTSRPAHSLAEVEGVAGAVPNSSLAVICGAGHKTLLTSGQHGVDADGVAPEDFQEQCDLAFNAIGLILADANMAPKDIVRISAFVTDAADIPAFQDAQSRFLVEQKPSGDDDDVDGFDSDLLGPLGDEPDTLPVSTLPAVSLAVVCGLARPELKVMVEVTAAVPKVAKQRPPASRGSGAAPLPADNPGKLFVGGLAWETDDFSLREAFDEFGPPLCTPPHHITAAAAAAVTADSAGWCHR